MKKLICTVLAAVMLASCVTVATAADDLPFSDVAPGAWYREEVRFVYENGIMKGVGGGRFSPDAPVTRAEIVTVLARLSGDATEGLGKELPFSDVAPGDWHADFVGWAVSSGVTLGYEDGTFRPDVPVKRQEIAALFARYINYAFLNFSEEPLTDGFTDAGSIPDWAREPVDAIRRYGLLSGNEKGEFCPDDATTRAETATVIRRFMTNKAYGEDPMFGRFARYGDLIPTDKSGWIRLEMNCRDRLVGSGTAQSLSAKLLPYMGLDTEEYEMVIDPSVHRDVMWMTDCSVTGDTVINNEGKACSENPALCRVAVRNKKTGETTPNRLLRLIVCRTPGPLGVDPDGWEPGIDADLFEKMKADSLYTLGDTERFAASFGKAEKGDPVTAVYIGGSVTARASAGDDLCFAMLTQNWLEKTFPLSDMTYINQGIASTSRFAILRLGQCVLKYDPDFVFIEFGQNDVPAARDREAFESVIRTLLERSDAAIMIVLTGIANKGNCEFMKEIADRYGVALCDVRTGADEALAAGAIFDFELAYDGGHPREWGHNHIASMIVHELKAIIDSVRTDGATAGRPMPDRATEAKTEGLVYVLPEEMGEPPAGWTLDGESGKFNPILTVTGPGADDLEIRCSGGELYLMTYNSRPFYVSVDGGDFVLMDDDESFCAVPPGEPAEHVVVIRPTWIDVGEDGHTAIRLGGYTYRPQA
ncbi:MAG: S-layer homology domain-containing protein [Clostridia bacterium]|nr:S-layer homology domain-containing protein [Clostridia bacterium]